MQRAIGAALVAAGIGLVVYGHNLSQGWAEKLTAAIEGASSDQVYAFYIGGAAVAAAGLALLVRGRGKGSR